MWTVVRCPGRRPARPRAGRPGRGRRYRASPAGSGRCRRPSLPGLWVEVGGRNGVRSVAACRPLGAAASSGPGSTGAPLPPDDGADPRSPPWPSTAACALPPGDRRTVSPDDRRIRHPRDLRLPRARPDRGPAHRCRPSRRPTSPDPRADHRRRPRTADHVGARWAAVRRGQRSAGEHRADAEGRLAGRPLIGDRHAVPGRRGAIRAAARLPAGDQLATTRRHGVMPRSREDRPDPTGLARPAGPPRSGSRTCPRPARAARPQRPRRRRSRPQARCAPGRALRRRGPVGRGLQRRLVQPDQQLRSHRTIRAVDDRPQMEPGEVVVEGEAVEQPRQRAVHPACRRRRARWTGSRSRGRRGVRCRPGRPREAAGAAGRRSSATPRPPAGRRSGARRGRRR